MKYGLALALLTVSTTAFAAEAQTPKADLAKGQQIASQTCAACHGADGNSPGATFPNLAGQHAAYIANQLANFKSGARKNEVMAPMAAALSEQDMHDVAAYFAGQKGKPHSAKDKALAEAGQKIYRFGISEKNIPACAACHGQNGAGIPAQFPRLSGQYSNYTVAQLKAYQAGTRGGANANIMKGVVERLTDADMSALGEYLSGLR